MAVVADQVVVELEAKLDDYSRKVDGARRQFEGDMDRIKRAGGQAEAKTKSAMRGIGSSVADALVARAGLAAVASSLYQLGDAAAKFARDAEELDSAIGYTFGRNADSIRAWADSTGASLGRASTDLKQAAMDFQTLFDPAVGGQKAVELSKQFAVLVQDLSSFRNVSEDIVRQNLVSGLVGETEPLRKFGIIINDNTVKAKALELGLVQAGQEVNDYGKIVARSTLILEQSKTAQGDLARTQGSATNQIRAAKSATKELAEEVGGFLNPVIGTLAGLWADVAKNIGGALSKFQEWRRKTDGAMPAAQVSAAYGKAADDFERMGKIPVLGAGFRAAAPLARAAAAATTPAGNGRRGSPAAVRAAAIARRKEEEEAAKPRDYAEKPTGSGKSRKAAVEDTAKADAKFYSETFDAIVKGRLEIESARIARETVSVDSNPTDFKPAGEAVQDATAALRSAQEEIYDSTYYGIRGGLEAAFDDGVPGIAQYLADTVKRSLLDSIAEALAQAVTAKSGGFILSAAGALFGRANGGNVVAGRPQMVGERGKEVFVPSQSGRIISNQALRSSSPVSRISPVLKVDINLTGANGDATIRRIAGEAAAYAAQQAYRRAINDAPAASARFQAERS